MLTFAIYDISNKINMIESSMGFHSIYQDMSLLFPAVINHKPFALVSRKWIVTTKQLRHGDKTIVECDFALFVNSQIQ